MLNLLFNLSNSSVLALILRPTTFIFMSCSLQWGLAYQSSTSFMSGEQTGIVATCPKGCWGGTALVSTGACTNPCSRSHQEEQEQGGRQVAGVSRKGSSGSVDTGVRGLEFTMATLKASRMNSFQKPVLNILARLVHRWQRRHERMEVQLWVNPQLDQHVLNFAVLT